MISVSHSPDKTRFWLAVLLAIAPMLYFFSKLLPEIAHQKTSPSLVFFSVGTLGLVITFLAEISAIVLLVRASISAPVRWVITIPCMFCASLTLFYCGL